MDGILLVILLLMQVADITTTAMILDQGGKELNPVVKWFMTNIGVIGGLCIIKLIIFLPVTVLTAYGLVPVWALAFGVILYIGVLINNFKQLR